MTDETKDLNEVVDSTTVDQVNVNIDELFGLPGAESVMLPDSDNEKPKSMFYKENVDTTFFDNPSTTLEDKKEAAEKRLKLMKLSMNLIVLLLKKKKQVTKEDQRLINQVLLS